MGGGRFDATDYSARARSYAGKHAADIFTSSTISATLDPKKMKIGSGPLAGMAVRESRDSDANPKSTPILVLSDVTGSMGKLATLIAQEGLGTIMKEIYDTKPIADPHMLLGAIGDADMADQSPLQVTQFEASVDPMLKQLEQIHVEMGGGGNSFESYHLAWLFAAMKTVSDCNEKRKDKGFLFTIGDEFCAQKLTVNSVKKVFGENLGIEADMDVKDVLAMAQRKYHVYHLIVPTGGSSERFYDYSLDGYGMLHAAKGDRGRATYSYQPWAGVMGENAILVKDYKALADVIVGIIRRVAGHSMTDILKGRSNSRALVVADALKNLPSTATAKADEGVVAL